MYYFFLLLLLFFFNITIMTIIIINYYKKYLIIANDLIIEFNAFFIQKDKSLRLRAFKNRITLFSANDQLIVFIIYKYFFAY